MIERFTFNKRIIFKYGIEFLSMPSKIKKLVELENAIVVLLDSSFGDRNIFCIDFSKQLKWQIPKPIEIHAENFFTGIYLREGGLFAYNVNGVEYYLEKETGQFLKWDLIK